MTQRLGDCHPMTRAKLIAVDTPDDSWRREITLVLQRDDGREMLVAVPVRALTDWLPAGEVTTPPAFRRGD